jgi:thioredoxin-like negative regulator of GroEL
MTWLNRAMLLFPTHPTPHLIAASVLASSGHKQQALLEYRTAIATAANGRDVLAMVASRYPAIDDLIAVTPRTVAFRIGLAKWLIARGRTNDADRVYQLIAEDDPKNVLAHQRILGDAVARADASAAEEAATALLAIDHSEESLELVASARILAGDLDGASSILDGISSHGSAALDLQLQLASAYSRKRDTERARARLAHLENTWQFDRDGQIRFYETRAQVEELAGNDHLAAWSREQAQRLKHQ